MIFDISVVDPFAASCDHSSLAFTVTCPSDHPSNSTAYFRDFGTADYALIISYPLDID